MVAHVDGALSEQSHRGRVWRDVFHEMIDLSRQLGYRVRVLEERG